MRKTFRYRLYPTKAQEQALEQQLREGCKLYNAALQERRDAWKKTGKSLNYYDQANQLKALRAEGLLELANFTCCQNILRRVHKTYQAFFARIKRGEKAGFPRFKPHQRFDSLTFPSYGDGIRLLPSDRLRVQGVGILKVKLHRPVEGKIKTVSLKREAGKWYVCFSVEVETPFVEHSLFAVGMDVGLESFAVLSDGTIIANPRQYRQAQKPLRRSQRKVARRKKGSHRRKKAVRELQKAHAHVRNQRQDFHHKLAHRLVRDFGLIAIEDLNVKGLAAGMLAKSVNDAGWSGFFSKLTYKAESAGRLLIPVNPRGTSQRCSACGVEIRKTLKDRWHTCPSCGLSVSRDLNSAVEILRLGLSLVDETWGFSPCVSTEAVCFS